MDLGLWSRSRSRSGRRWRSRSGLGRLHGHRAHSCGTRGLELHIALAVLKGGCTAGHILMRPGRGMAGGNGVTPLGQCLETVARQGQQIGTGGLVLGQPGIEHALHGPGRLAERGQSHHAATALEGVERPAQGRELGRIGRIGLQGGQGGLSVADHLGSLFHEDVAQLGVIDEIVDDAIVNGSRCRNRRLCHRDSSRRNLGCRLGHLDCGSLRCLCHCCALGGLQLQEFFAVRMEPELLAHLLGLVAHHVEQEGQIAQIRAEQCQGVLRVCLRPGSRLRSGLQQPCRLPAHGLGCGAGFVEAQHGQQTGHGGQPGRHGLRGVGVGRVAEEGVERLFDLAEQGTRLLHDVLHGVAVALTHVERLHPGVRSTGVLARCGLGDAPGQLGGALAQDGVIPMGIVEQRLQIQHGRRNLQPDGRQRRSAGCLDLARDLLQDSGQGAFLGPELVPLLHGLRQGVAQAVELAHVACSHFGPQVLEGEQLLAHLLEGFGPHGAIQQLAVAGHGHLLHAIARDHGPCHCHGNLGRQAVHAQRREIQQILPLPRGHLGGAVLQRCQLGSRPRQGTLEVVVELHAAHGQDFGTARKELPEGPGCRLRGRRCEPQSQSGEVGRPVLPLRPQGPEQHVEERGLAHLAARTDLRRRSQGLPLPMIGMRPQIGRMHPAQGRELGHRPIGREKTRRQIGLTPQHVLQIVHQGPAGLIDQRRGLGRAQLGLVDQPPGECLHGPHYEGGRRPVDHVEHPHGIVQPLSRESQRSGVDGGDVAALGSRHLLAEPLELAVGQIQRFLQRVHDPGQRP